MIDENVIFQCAACNKILKSRRAFVLHINKTHKELGREYLRSFYDIYLKKEGEGYCKLSGKPSDYKNFMSGYTDICKAELQTAKLTNQVNYWIYRYNKTPEEARELVRLEQTKRSLKRKSIEGYNPRKSTPRCKEYWMSKFNFSEELANEAVSKHQSEAAFLAHGVYKNKKRTLLEYWIERHGEIDGPIKFQEYNDKKLLAKKERNKNFKKIPHAGNISNVEATMCNMLFYMGYKSAKFLKNN